VYLFEVLGAPDLEVVGGGVEGVQGVVIGDLVSVFSTSIGEGSVLAGGGDAVGEDSGSSSTIALALKRKEVNLVTEKVKVLKNEKKGE
jgi:hypothetical protein